MKGILLAGGEGTRLRPLSIATSKQLLPVYDKPMIYYPLSTLMLAGITEILVISTRDAMPQIMALLGDGSALGLKLTYKIQEEPGGIAQAILLAKEFLNGASVGLVLGDNIFYGSGLGRSISKFQNLRGAQIFAHAVEDPRAYGVVEFDKSGKAKSLEEKPAMPKSSFAVPGIYFYDSSVVEYAEKLVPSARGELEITDLNRLYLEDGLLNVEVLPRGTAWFDAGTFESLSAASNFVRTIQLRQGISVLAPEEIAWRMGYIGSETLQQLGVAYGKSSYGQYLQRIYENEARES
jgi:glucose-1-phosphate thymidylyltransferase